MERMCTKFASFLFVTLYTVIQELEVDGIADL